MAKFKLLLFMLGLVLFVGQFREHQGCNEEERRSLLKFKAYVRSNGYDADSLLPSWVNEPLSDCCLWHRVKCSNFNITDHVIELSLDNIMDYYNDYIPSPLNISIFEAFKELRILNLSWNGIDHVQKEGSSGLLRLQKLETLDLSYNLFSNSSLRSLRGLMSLKKLIVTRNSIRGTFPVEEVSVLENLELLDLSENHLEGSLTMQDLNRLSKLRKLKYLDLSRNFFNKDIMRFVESLPSLKSLHLHDAFLGESKSTISEQDLKTLTRLEILDLSWNNLVGSIPSNVGELASLKALSLASNDFDGSLPIPGICQLNRLQELDLSDNSFEGILPSCLCNMTSLRYIDLSGNHFEGSFNFSSLANHSELDAIMLTCHGDKLKTDAEHLHQTPLFQLEVLRLPNCDLKNIPPFLLYQHRLKVIDLSHNELNGMFPTWLAENNAELEYLNLRGNSLSGQFHLPTRTMREIGWVDVSSNHFSGQLQDDFGKVFSNAKVMNLSNNHFEGDLPSSICVTTNLEVLDLSSNNFTGELPKELLARCANLNLLWLSHNKFHGEIFSSHFNLSWLSYLELRDNQFRGSLSLPNHVELSFLNVLDISNNLMAGGIPSWIGHSTTIRILALHNNSFKGPFPCKDQLLSVKYLDLSYNSLRGPLPYCFNQDYLKQLNLEGNQFWGSIPSALFMNFSALMVLNLRDNQLSGIAPYVNINRTVPSLRFLLLGKNSLRGSIPELFCQFTNIDILDLSNNFFSGPVPRCFSNISFGKIKEKSDSNHTLSNEDFLDRYFPLPGYSFPSNLLSYHTHEAAEFYSPAIRFELDFVTKNSLYFYKGDILNFMSGLDLSCNNLTGNIPISLGNMSSIHALNLSHNRVVGTIPISFSKLAEIESLDLSYNNLSGEIPSELTNLVRLGAFSVAHNNLSGKIPFWGQLSTFEESSYEGNPLLFGMPLNRNCTIPPTPYLPIVPSDETQGQWFEVDSVAFYSSFFVTYLVLLLSFLVILFINPFWRRRWLQFIENFLNSRCYFAYDTLGKLSAKL
ncbi:hypothetical protein DITRI_Ditri20bG0139700 [Diplodiscus trichospermus]